MRKLTFLLLMLALLGALTSCEKDKTAVISSNSPIRDYAVNSNNIIQNKKGTMLFTANIDVNSVTIFNPKNNKVISEIPVGKEPRQLAISPDENYLFVSCMLDQQVDIISIEDQKVISTIKTEIEPYGVLTSQDGKKLYVSNYRSGTISVIDLRNNKTIETIKVEERPRSLALTADGKKLYVPHYLDGSISVIETKNNQVSSTILLAKSPDQADRKKSQGIPNTLEQFVISPDGKKAWIPHLLTNTDTPVHFEETIFPAISVIDLEKDEEIIEERKELFAEINVKDSKNQTIIVSNPYDIIFEPNGKKAFSIMSGSEDLVVFDLSRGGNATQVLRRIEGNNPRGAVISPDGEKIYVHNAMSHDLASIKTGGKSSFARAKMESKNVPLIKNDSLEPLVREGKTIFYSGNSEEYTTEITGNNWMSCISCHADGDINGLSIMTKKGIRNVPSNVLTTKTGLFMWDGSRDDFTDYILTVQGEMGGMSNIDPGKPIPKDVEHMYDALFAYLDQPESFPPPKSPYRTEKGELTSTAQEGRQLFEGKAGCLSCHSGPQFTDSGSAKNNQGILTTDNTNFLHDIGTSNAKDQLSKGDKRANMSNPRDNIHFDTPTLRGVWATAPYFHDGSANTISDSIKQHDVEDVSDLTASEIEKIAEYVKSIE